METMTDETTRISETAAEPAADYMPYAAHHAQDAINNTPQQEAINNTPQHIPPRTHNQEYMKHNQAHQTHNTQPTTHNTQPSTPDTQPTTHNTQPSTPDTQHTINHTQHTTKHTGHTTNHTQHTTKHTEHTTNDTPPNPFAALGLSDYLLRTIEEEHFVEPSEIQERTIPLTLQGKDVLAGSATGSGKTLAFGAGIIQKAVRGTGVQALILTPTRELAEQVCESLRTFSKYKPLTMVAAYGGVSINPQIDALRRADIVIGTPGRIIDHLERGTLVLRGVKTLVLDEADRMLDMGFIEDVEHIISACPVQRQTLLFSATLSQEIQTLAQRYMEEPASVSVDCYVDAGKLLQTYYDTPDRIKFSLLVHLLRNEEADLVMVFCNSQKTTDIVARNLKRNGIDALAIHGGFSQGKRNMVMKQFHAGKTRVLACTDVAARGLDIEGVSHVYNYDVPKESKQYVHRIGRTARAGRDGKAITILTSRDHDNFRRVLRENDVSIAKEDVPSVQNVPFRWTEQPHQHREHQGPRHRTGGFGRDPARHHGRPHSHANPRSSPPSRSFSGTDRHHFKGAYQ